MADRARATAARARRLREYLKGELERTKLKLKAPDLEVRVQANPPRVMLEDPERMPEDFTETVSTVKVLRAEIGRALKAGKEVPGACLERTTRLVIRAICAVPNALIIKDDWSDENFLYPRRERQINNLEMGCRGNLPKSPQP